MTPTSPFKEEWRIVPSFPNLEASSWGRIRVIPYERPMPHGGVRRYGGIPTFGQWDGERFIYNQDGKNKTYRVARLICEAFNGPPPFPEAVAMHDDEDSRNNLPDNLVWGTQKQNLNYPGFLAYCRSRTGENSPSAKGKNK